MASQGFNNTGFNAYTGNPEALAMHINTSGLVTKPKQTVFSGVLNTEMAVTGDGTVAHPGAVVPVTVLTNIGSAFNPGNGTGTGCSFTAPVTGIYLFSFVPIWTITAASGSVTGVVQVVTTSYTYTFQDLPTTDRFTGFFGTNNFISVTTSCIASMSASDTAQFTVTVSGAAAKNGEIGGGYVSGILLA